MAELICDTSALIATAAEYNLTMPIVEAAREINRRQRERVVDKLLDELKILKGRTIGLLGLAFKPNTNSVASSASINLVKQLMLSGAHVRAYDPIAMPDAQLELQGDVCYCDSAYSVAEGADVLVLSTGWPEFRTLDFDRIRRVIKRPVVVDTKNLLDGARMRALGFEYLGVGRA